MEDWNRKLITAARTGDSGALKLCLQNDADIEFQTVGGRTALMFAACEGQLEICRLLIDTGCKIHTTDTEDGWTALMFAANEGHLEICRLLIDKGCKIDTTTEDGLTALMFAASGGHLEICKLLIDKGCKIDTTTTGDGWTALMFPAWEGHLEICKLLIDKGCKIDTTTRDGYTALHWAAECGHLQTTRCLVEQGGASPLVTTHKGQTPYNLAAAEKQGQYREVMEYLQSVMSEKSSGVTAGQGMEDEMVPTEIKLMADKRSIDLYLKLLESGSEKKRDIRLVVVGKQGAGKTSLIKRLFSEENTDVTSTNGIEIHTIKCKAMSDDGIWNKLDGTNEETEIHARLLKQYKETIEASVEEGAHEAVKENTLTTILYKRIEESKESETVSQQPKKRKHQVTTESQVEPPVTSQQRNQALEQAKMDIEAMLKSNVDLHNKEEYATLLLWDFAGDEEFYHTHQTFLSQDAIYLVVTKLNEADDKQAQDLFQLWQDSIHCYSRLEEDKSNSADSKSSDDLDPPVVIVGTWKDAVTSDVEEIDDACRENILKFTKNMSEDQRRHIRQVYFISNTEDDPSVFQQIREDILNLARKMKTWNIDYPLKFIQLEKRLQGKKKDLPIISFQEIWHICTDTPNPLNDEELKLFLEFHHEIRALVYFKDLPSYIILDTQWLSDVFKRIVTARKFRAISIRNKKKWDELYSKGTLQSEVLEDIFKKENFFSKHKDHILNVMEKFDIIIRPTISERDTADETPLYYVPCMIKAEPECDIYEIFNVTEDNCKKSTWLCFKFRFLPPYLINHLIASLSREYDVAEVGVSRQEKRKIITKEAKKRIIVKKQSERVIALFKGTVVFELLKTTKLRKLLVMKILNVIQIQILEFGKSAIIERGMYKHIAKFVIDEINKIISTRFRMTNVVFEKRWECGLTKPECVTGSNDFNETDFREYYCEKCTTIHNFIDEWSDHPTKKGIYEKKQEQKGLVLIVNFMFSGRDKRKGSDKDVEELTHFFEKELGYQVERRSDMTKKDLQDCFKDIESEYLTEKSTDYHSFICIIMSHGNKKGIKTEDKYISVTEITNPFKNKTEGKFYDKPRLFLIQACRGKQRQKKVDLSNTLDQTSKHDVCPGNSQSRSGSSGSSEYDYCTDGIEDIPRLPIDADIIVAYATTPGYKANRHRKLGSHFIRAFLDVARKKYKDFDVEDILRDVRAELAENPEYGKSEQCQMGIIESTSRKKFFFT